MSVLDCTDALVENLNLVNSPEKHLMFRVVRGEVGHVTVFVDRHYQQGLLAQHSKRRADHEAFVNAVVASGSSVEDPSFKWPFPAWLQPEDLNTDGIDPSGSDVWVHDGSILNDDDSVTIKPSGAGNVGHDGTKYDCSQNMLIENMVMTGFGASVGSVGPGTDRPCVNNITFRNITMPHSGKGVYVKSNGDPCTDGVSSSQISNIFYEGIHIIKPVWWAVWVGPQQQSEPYEKDENSGKCSLLYPINPHCPAPACADFINITLKDIVIEDPLMSPGIIMGNVSNPMDVHFVNVTVTGKLPKWPYGDDGYMVVATDGTCDELTSPCPPTFTAA